MKLKILFSILILTGVGVAVFFSHHGYRDLLELQRKHSKIRDRVEQVERENEDLKRQASLILDPSEDLLEKQVRDFLGWVKPTELVYVEKSAQRLTK